MISPSWRPWAILVLAIGLVAMNGCGDGRPKRAPVTGLVIYHGKPVSGAGVTFYTPGGAIAMGMTDANGRFTLTTFDANDGAIIGESTVSVNKFIPDPDAPGPEALRPKIPILPHRYSSMLESPLHATVKAGVPNDFRFELTD